MKQVMKNFLSNTNLFVIVYINIAGFFCLHNLFHSSTDISYYFLILLSFIVIKMIGIEAGYHRLLSHRGYNTSRYKRFLMLLLATIGGQGSPLVWAGLHRYGHHGFADKDKDPHTPKNGFWHSYVLWMFKITEKDINIRSISDLLKDKDIVFFHKNSTLIFIIVHLIIFLINQELYIYILGIPIFLTFHSFCIQTSVVHCKLPGYKNFSTTENSLNMPWLFLFVQGECWHNNHHAHPNRINFKEKWWEFDPTYYIVKLIKN